MDPLKIITALFFFAIAIVCMADIANKLNHNTKIYLHPRKKVLGKRQETRKNQISKKSKLLPPTRAKNILTKEEKKRAINEWKKEEAIRKTLKEKEEREERKQEAQQAKEFAAASKAEQRRILREAELSRLTHKYGKKTALEMIDKGAVGGTAKPSKPSAPARVKKKSGWVYVIQDKTTGLYKIGRTINIERRMNELGVGKSARLVQQKMVDDCYAVERDAHQRYKGYRLPQSEYFKLSSAPSVGD